MVKIQICMYVVCLACSVILNVLLLSNYVYVGGERELSWSNRGSRSSGSNDMLRPKLFLAQSRQIVKGQKSPQTNECAKTVISRAQRFFQKFQRILMTQHFIRCLSFFLLSSQNTISQISSYIKYFIHIFFSFLTINLIFLFKIFLFHKIRNLKI